MSSSGMQWSRDFSDWVDEYEESAEELAELADEAVEREAYRAMAKSKEITPVSPGGGRLRDSAEVKQVSFGVYIIVYPVWYAIYVHERTELFHPRPPAARSKFLESALRLIGRDFEDNVKDYIDSRL
ncbi:MAG: hypothetical protein ABEN55_21700 [Bradymonadaceae bacterium]